MAIFSIEFFYYLYIMTLEDLRNTPFRMQDLSSVFTNCVNLATKAKRLEQDGKIIRLKKGLYVTSPRISRMELSPFLLANHIYGPSYVSMQTALRYYGLIPEAVYSAQSMTTGVARDYENTVGTFNYIHVPTRYYNIGVTMNESAGVTFMIATPEKALCDLLYKKEPVYSIKQLKELLFNDLRIDENEFKKLNKKDIISICDYYQKKNLNFLKKMLKEEERK